MSKLLVALLLAFAATAACKSSVAAEVATGKQINADGYGFSLEGVGRLILRRIEIDGTVSDDCRVDVDSLRQIILNGARKKSLELEARDGDGKTYITISLKRHKTTDTDTGRPTVNCWGEGTGCKAKIEVTPPAEEVLRAMML